MKVPVSNVNMDSNKQAENDKVSLLKGGGMRRLSVFGKHSDLDMVSWIKGLALDPCSSVPSPGSIRPLWNQTIKVRKLMTLSSAGCPRVRCDYCTSRFQSLNVFCTWKHIRLSSQALPLAHSDGTKLSFFYQRKRKLQQFLRDNFAAARRLTLEISDQRSVENVNKGHFSRASSNEIFLSSVDTTGSFNLSQLHCSQSLVTTEDTFPGKQIPIEFPHLDDRIDWDPSEENICPSLESEESDNGSILHDPSSFDLDDDSVNSSKSSSCEDAKELHLQQHRQSMRLRNFIGDHLPRIAIPVGPRFQADVPEWIDPPNKGSFDFLATDSENSRWLGTKIWPPEGKTMETNDRAVGKGRPDSCSCVSPRSIGCRKRHIIDERFRLQSHLGAAFLSWKFDEMGKDISESWTLKEQKRFESIAKTYPISKGKDFLKHALKCFPLKGKDSILSYYFNVFIPDPAN